MGPEVFPRDAAAPVADVAGCPDLGEGENGSLVEWNEGHLERDREFLFLCGKGIPESLPGLVAPQGPGGSPSHLGAL